jgi:hypothetical protein
LLAKAGREPAQQETREVTVPRKGVRLVRRGGGVHFAGLQLPENRFAGELFFDGRQYFLLLQEFLDQVAGFVFPGRRNAVCKQAQVGLIGANALACREFFIASCK